MDGDVFLDLDGVELLRALTRWEDLGPAGEGPEAGVLTRHRQSGIYAIRRGGEFRSIDQETGRHLDAEILECGSRDGDRREIEDS